MYIYLYLSLYLSHSLSLSLRFHQFCRFLGKLKSNYQLTELVNTEGYQKWIQLASQFSIDSFRQWQLSSASSHYILQLWSRMVTAMPYVREEAGVGGHLLNEYVPRIMQAYINGKLQEIEAAVKCENGIVLVGIDGEVEHPLNDPEVLETHLAVRACVRACVRATAGWWQWRTGHAPAVFPCCS